MALLKKWMSFFILMVIVFAYQNCGKFHKQNNFTNSQSSSSSNDITDAPPISSPISSGSGQINSWSDRIEAPQIVDNCMNRSDFNFCTTMKDPVSAFLTTGGFNPAFTTTNATAAQENGIFKFGLNLPAGPLVNGHFELVAIANSGITVPQLPSAQKLRFGGDSNHSFTQVSAYYWLNRQRQYMIERTGDYYFSNQKSKLYAYDTTVADNAYFSPSDKSMHVGYRRFSAQLRGDLGIDSSIVAHEAGHGNLYMASNGQNTIGGETILRSGAAYCRTRAGCFGAIHEGQADVHAFMLFPNFTPIIGAYFVNDVKGMRSPATVKTSGVTVDDFFNKRSGEIHDMGEVYAAIWYEVWNQFKQAKKEKNVEQLFSDHLTVLTSDDNFTTALVSIETLIDQTQSNDAAVLKSAFRSEYERLKIPVAP